jgi:hypothetical protein
LIILITSKFGDTSGTEFLVGVAELFIPKNLFIIFMKAESAMEGGFSGATTLTILHEIVRKFSPDAPRMDEIGKQGLAKVFDKLKLDVPDNDQLYLLATGLELLTNGLYYSLAGAGNKNNVLAKGALLGLLAGIGAVTLPGKLGLDEHASSRTPKTAVMTVAYYLIGGIIAAAVAKRIEERKRNA